MNPVQFIISCHLCKQDPLEIAEEAFPVQNVTLRKQKKKKIELQILANGTDQLGG